MGSLPGSADMEVAEKLSMIPSLDRPKSVSFTWPSESRRICAGDGEGGRLAAARASQLREHSAFSERFKTIQENTTFALETVE